MKSLIILLVLSLTACTSAEKSVNTDPSKNPFLFPYGNYVHQVKIRIPTNPDPSKRNFDFRGAVKIAADTIKIVVLSQIGTTLFKMSEDRATGKIEVENFVPQLKPYESKLTDYYGSLRVLLTARRHPEGKEITLDSSSRPVQMESVVAGRPTKFGFADYDEHEIPTRLTIESDTFGVDVKVLGYEI